MQRTAYDRVASDAVRKGGRPASAALQRGVAVVAAILLVAFLLGENLLAKWWIIDDHEIMWFLGSAGHLSISEIVPKLMQTEVGPGSSLARFRPTYYVLRLMETWAWGNRPELWYSFRLLIFAFFLFTVWETARLRIGLAASAPLTLYVASFAFWGDVFARLGPSETYAVLGLAFSILGWDAIGRSALSARGWALLLMGTVLAAGSKENFVLLGLLCAGTLGYCVVNRTASRAAWICVALALLWCGWITAVIILRTHETGADVYGNPVSPAARLGEVAGGVGKAGILPLYGFGGAFLFAWYLMRGRNATAARAALTGVITSVLLLGLYLSQLAFYGGNWPTGMRYDLPGVLWWPIMLFVILWYLRQLSASFGARPEAGVALRASVILVGLLAVASNAAGFVQIRQTSAENVRRTVRFTDSIERLSGSASQHAADPVLVQSDLPSDFEPLVSYPRFLKAYGVHNDMYLLWTIRVRPESKFDDYLSTQLSQFSSAGLQGEYLPLAQLTGAADQCILVVLAGSPARPCSLQVDGRWRE